MTWSKVPKVPSRACYIICKNMDGYNKNRLSVWGKLNEIIYGQLLAWCLVYVPHMSIIIVAVVMYHWTRYGGTDLDIHGYLTANFQMYSLCSSAPWRHRVEWRKKSWWIDEHHTWSQHIHSPSKEEITFVTYIVKNSVFLQAAFLSSGLSQLYPIS